MRTTVVALIVLALAVVACSDRVPAPATPTPSPRPGYPPAPASELPEGVLYVQGPTAKSKVFRIHREEDAEPVGAPVVWPVSPEGSRAVALTYGDRGVVLEIGILTGDGYEPIVEGEVIPSSPAFVWSKDGKRLAYTVPRDPASTQVEVWSFDAETGEKRLLSPEPGDRWLVGWTAGGDALAVQTEGIELLAKGRHTIPLPEPGMVVDLAVSPDGTMAAALTGDNVRVEDYYETRYSGLWLLDLDTLTWRRLVDMSRAARAEDKALYVSASIPSRPRLARPALLKGLGPMSWSPDNRRLSFYSPQGPGGPVYQFGLNVVDVLTGDEWHLDDQANWQDAWSQDGRYLAYVYETTNAAGQSERHLGILGPDGRTRRMANVRRVAWAKDGRLLVDIPGHLSLLDPETMELKEVRTESGETITALLEAPVWSPSGRYFALSTPADMYHRSSLYVIDTEEGTAEVFLDEAGFSAVAWLRE